MTPHEELSTLLFGGTEEEIAKARAHVVRCEACSAAHQEINQGLATPRLREPSSGVRERLLELARASRRMLVFSDRLAKLFGLQPVAASQLLNQAYDPRAWHRVGPGLSVMKVKGGGEQRLHECLLLELEPGAELPDHPHLHGEHVLVLQGGFKDDLGNELWRGESAWYEAGTHHALHALQGEACVAAVVTLKQPR